MGPAGIGAGGWDGGAVTDGDGLVSSIRDDKGAC
jgi:hypothetical protein